MKAILGYNYAKGKWFVIDIMVGPLTASAETYKRCQVDNSVYTEIPLIEVGLIDDIDGEYKDAEKVNGGCCG